MSRQRVQALLFALVAALSLPGIARWTELWSRPLAFDFQSYVVAAQRIATGDLTLYTISREGVPDYLYPPLFAFLMQVFARMPFVVAQDLWLLINAACTAGALALTVATLGRRLARREWVLVIGAAILFPPLFRTVRAGQIVCVLLLLLALAIWAMRRERVRWAGVALAVASAIKVYPAIFFLTALAQSRWRLIVAGALSALLLAALSIATVGWPLHQSFLLELLPDIARRVIPSPANQSLAALFARANTDVTAIATLLSLVMIAATLVLVRAASGAQDLHVFALTTVLMVVVPSRSWDFNYLLLLGPPLLLYLSNQLQIVCLLAYGLIVLERYWPLLPDYPLFHSFALIGALILWGGCALDVARQRKLREAIHA